MGNEIEPLLRVFVGSISEGGAIADDTESLRLELKTAGAFGVHGQPTGAECEHICLIIGSDGIHVKLLSE